MNRIRQACRLLLPPALLMGAVPATLVAQLERIDVPAGAVRIDGFVSLANVDMRFNDGTEESILGSVAAPLTEAESEVNVGVMGLGVALGLVNRVTIFGRVPIVRYRSRATIRSDSAPETRQDTSVTAVGDIEVGASFTLVDHWDRNGRLGGIRSAVDATVRLPTGDPKDLYDPLQLGTGSGQTDVVLGGVFEWGAGNWGVRLTGGYTWRLPTTVQRFVRSPEDPTDFMAPVATMSWTPGNAFHLAAQPFFRLASAFALQITAAYRVHGEDQYDYATDADIIPGIDPVIMSEGTAGNSLSLGGGVSYSSPSTADARAQGLPVEAFWRYQEVVRSTKGLVPKGGIMRLGLRLYFGLWGRANGAS